MINVKKACRQAKVVPLRNRQQQRTARHLKIIVTVLAVLYFSVLLAHQGWRMIALKRNLVDVEQEIISVRSQNELLLREIEQLHSLTYLEKLAREELGMVRPDEILFFFREDESQSAGER
jgi:cell division protein FtsB